MNRRMRRPLVDAYSDVAEKYNQLGKLDKYIEFLRLAVGESPRQRRCI